MSSTAPEEPALVDEYLKTPGFRRIVIRIVFTSLLLVGCFFIPKQLSVLSGVTLLAGAFSASNVEDDSLFKDLKDELSVQEITLFETKILLIIGLACCIAFDVILLWKPELTTGKQHYWKILVGAFVAILITALSVPIFLELNIGSISNFFETLDANKPSGTKNAVANCTMLQDASFKLDLLYAIIPLIYGGSVVFAALLAWYRASVYTMDDDYRGCCYSLKLKKPYKKANTLPIYYYDQNSQLQVDLTDEIDLQ